jgi:hypothetical protein
VTCIGAPAPDGYTAALVDQDDTGLQLLDDWSSKQLDLAQLAQSCSSQPGCVAFNAAGLLYSNTPVACTSPWDCQTPAYPAGKTLVCLYIAWAPRNWLGWTSEEPLPDLPSATAQHELLIEQANILRQVLTWHGMQMAAEGGGSDEIGGPVDGSSSGLEMGADSGDNSEGSAEASGGPQASTPAAKQAPQGAPLGGNPERQLIYEALLSLLSDPQQKAGLLADLQSLLDAGQLTPTTTAPAPAAGAPDGSQGESSGGSSEDVRQRAVQAVVEMLGGDHTPGTPRAVGMSTSREHPQGSSQQSAPLSVNFADVVAALVWPAWDSTDPVYTGGGSWACPVRDQSTWWVVGLVCNSPLLAGYGMLPAMKQATQGSVSCEHSDITLEQFPWPASCSGACIAYSLAAAAEMALASSKGTTCTRWLSPAYLGWCAASNKLVCAVGHRTAFTHQQQCYSPAVVDMTPLL